MAEPKSTPTASTETDDNTLDVPEPTRDDGPQQEVTTREDYRAYMEQKRAEQQGRAEPAPDPAPDPDPDDDTDPDAGTDPDPDAGGTGQGEDKGGEGEATPDGEGKKPKGDEDDDEIPPHKRQLGIDSEGNFEKADRPPSATDQSWFANLPEEARQRIQQQEQYANSIFQSYQALQGRVAPMQRLVEDLRKEVGGLREQLQNTDQTTHPNPTLEDLDSNAAWKEVAEEFPDESGELRKLFAGKESALQQAQQQVQQLTDQLGQVQQERRTTEWSRLRARHPDADQVRQHPAFHQFLQRLQANPQANPELVRKMASPFYEDIADLIDEFKREYFAGQQPPPNQAPAGQQPPTHQQGGGQPGSPAVPAHAATPPAHEGQPAPSRPKPPAPSPESQGAGMSGARGRPAALSDREAFRQLMERKRRRSK